MTIEEMNVVITEFCDGRSCSLCPLQDMKGEGLITTCDEDVMSDEMVIEAYRRITRFTGEEVDAEFELGDITLAELFGLQ